MFFKVYILRFTNNSLYIGQTNNLDQRLRDHKNKATRASKFSKENGDFELIHQENYQTQLEAMRREKQLKGWTRAKKGSFNKRKHGTFEEAVIFHPLPATKYPIICDFASNPL